MFEVSLGVHRLDERDLKPLNWLGRNPHHTAPLGQPLPGAQPFGCAVERFHLPDQPRDPVVGTLCEAYRRAIAQAPEALLDLTRGSE